MNDEEIKIEENDNDKTWLKDVKLEEMEAKINLGCGIKKIPGFVNIDKDPKVDPDIIMDVEEGLVYIEDNSVDMVLCIDLLEHISSTKVNFVIEEIYRVLKPDGIFETWVPSTDGRGAFQDPTHKSFWNMNSWLYWINDEYRDYLGTKARFRMHHCEDKLTNEKFKVIHTHAIMTAIKG